MKDLDGHTAPIRELFSQNSFYRVPHYQRPFSWDADNFDDLIDDLINADKQQQYFLGTIVLHATDAQGNYDIDDGQQRLTSIMILLACLRDRTSNKGYADPTQQKIHQPENKADGIPEKTRLEVRDREIFNDVVVKPSGTKQSYDPTTMPEPVWRYIVAIRTFATRLDLLTEEQINELIEFVSQNCVVIRLTTPSFSDAYRLFTIVNDRGKQLRRIDILKARNLAPDIIASDNKRRAIAAKWQEYENNLGGDDFESVFQMLRLITLRDKPMGDLLFEFEKRIFGKKMKMGEPFFDQSFAYADHYRALFVDRDIYSDNEPKRIRFSNLMYIMRENFQASEWRACMLSFVNKFGYEMSLEFLLKLEKVYLTHWIAGLRKDERYGVYAGVLEKIDSAKSPQQAVGSIAFDKKAILDGVGNSRLYGAEYVKYVLLRLELLASEQDQVRDMDAKSIEHVLPQTPEAGSNWLMLHAKDELKDYVDSVGNLVLMSKSKNSSAGRKEFPEKIKGYLRPRVSDYPRSAEVLAESQWTKQTILDRTEAAKKIFLNDI